MLGREAAEKMQQWHIERKTGVKGMCLKTCRLAWNISAKYPSAISAWDNTPKKNKFIDPMSAPIGATHFWKGGRFGHVAIQSHKAGYIWSTDIPDKDFIGLTYYTSVKDKWGYKYLGWTNKLNGVDLNVKA